jgi:NAD(P)-dependent dehydrogenase (short-subunit alcohol dehydrogenase family)
MTPDGRTADGLALTISPTFSCLCSSSQTCWDVHWGAQFQAVFLSSISHRTSEANFNNLNLESEYGPCVAYAQSRTANLWTANEVERRYGSQGLQAWSVQSGPTGTDLNQHMTEAVAATQSDPTLATTFKGLAQGAATTAWLATAAAWEVEGGKYLVDCQVSRPYNLGGL